MSLLLTGVVILLTGGTAKAAFSDLSVVLPDDPGGVQFINLSNGQNDSEGNGAFVPSSYFKVYAENNSRNHTVEFDIVNRAVGRAKACYWYQIAWGTKRLDSYGVVSGGYVGGEQRIRIRGCSLGSSPDRGTPYRFTIPGSRLTPQLNVPGHVGPGGGALHETWLQLNVLHDPTQGSSNPVPPVPDPGPGQQTATLRLYMDGADRGPGDARLGFIGGWPATTYPANGSKTALSTTWRAPCDSAPNRNERITWFDMDWPPATARQPDNPRGRIYEYNPSTSPPTIIGGGPRGSGPGIQTSMDYGGSGRGSATVTTQPGRSYELRFENINGSNGVRIDYPYDTGDFYLKCPDPPQTPPPVAGCNTSTISNPGTYVSPGGNSFETRTRVVVTDSGGNRLVDQYVGNGQTRTFNYLPMGRDVTVTATRERRTQTGAWGTTQGMGPPFTSTQTCYSASCTAHFASDVAGKPNGVKGGGGFFYVNITNTGRLMLPDSLAGTPLSLGGTGFAGSFYRTLGIYPGQTVPVALDGVVAPRGVGRPTFGVDLSYRGRPTLEPLAQCSATPDVYEPFNLIPIVNSLAFDPDPEDPNRVDYNTQIVHNTAAPYVGNPVDATSTRYLFLRRGGTQSTLQGPSPDHNQFITRGYTDTYNAPPDPPRYFQVGDRICAVITIDKGSGYIGPGGSTDTAEEVAASSEPPSSCDIVENRPYVRNYIGDVIAGGRFKGPGTAGSGIVKTYNRGGSGEIGSGVEFAAEAISSITGFSSAFLRTAAPISPYGLSFANDNNAPCSPTLPGCFQGSREVRNYFEEDMKHAIRTAGPTAPPGGQINLNAIEPQVGEQTWYQGGAGKIELNNPDAAHVFSGRHEIFVDGDVFIKDDIIYTDGPWTNIDQIPNLRFVVRGNIYISRDVGQLDGLYVAQPKIDGTGGVIYTCVDPGTTNPFPRDALYDGCNDKKLQVNGSFIAQDIKFLRTIFTLSEAVGCPAPKLRENFGCDHAAESFRLSPDFFLGIPASQPTGGQNNSRFDDIKTLPPIL